MRTCADRDQAAYHSILDKHIDHLSHDRRREAPLFLTVPQWDRWAVDSFLPLKSILHLDTIAVVGGKKVCIYKQ